MTAKPIPRVVGGEDCGEVQVMDILDRARAANLSKVVLIGCNEDGDIFRGSNLNELETVGLHFNAALMACVEDED